MKSYMIDLDNVHWFTNAYDPDKAFLNPRQHMQLARSLSLSLLNRHYYWAKWCYFVLNATYT